jgi:aspartyl-tRNA synthetase
MKRYYCNEVNDKHIKNTVKVFGWVAKRRDHGGIIFIDLRDHTGIVQLVLNPDNQGLF